MKISKKSPDSLLFNEPGGALLAEAGHCLVSPNVSLPSIDFKGLLQEQLERARELKSRFSRKSTLGERLLSLIEGPWAPDPADLPERPSAAPSRQPFRSPLTSEADRQSRDEVRQQLLNGQRRWSLSSWTSVYQYDVPVRRLPRDLEGLTILHLSDIHLLRGSERPVRELSKIADYLCTGGIKADLLLVSGDIITRSPEDLCRQGLRELGRIAECVPLSFMVHGNHDYHGHLPAHISHELERVGISDINNQAVRVSIGSSALNIIGVDDAYFGRPKCPHGVTPAEINIVLTHNLDSIRGDFPKDIDVILSGHTHWGEARFLNGAHLMKMWGYSDNINRHTKGWDVLSDRTLSYVHPGLARYYVPYKGLRHPPGIAIHRLTEMATADPCLSWPQGSLAAATAPKNSSNGIKPCVTPQDLTGTGLL